MPRRLPLLRLAVRAYACGAAGNAFFNNSIPRRCAEFCNIFHGFLMIARAALFNSINRMFSPCFLRGSS